MDKRCIALGSCSFIKEKALKSAFQNFEIVCFNTESGVPAQPKGKEQTETGARNRCKKASIEAKREKNFVLAFGIENGCYKDGDGYWYDIAAICVMNVEDGRELVFWSEKLQICKKQGCMLCCDEDGNMLIDPGPNGEWSELKDPHIVVTKGEKSREMFLSDAIEKSKQKCLELLH